MGCCTDIHEASWRNEWALWAQQELRYLAVCSAVGGERTGNWWPGWPVRINYAHTDIFSYRPSRTDLACFMTEILQVPDEDFGTQMLERTRDELRDAGRLNPTGPKNLRRSAYSVMADGYWHPLSFVQPGTLKGSLMLLQRPNKRHQKKFVWPLSNLENSRYTDDLKYDPESHWQTILARMYLSKMKASTGDIWK